MPPFKPAQARVPRSRARVPYQERAKEKPQEEDPSKAVAPLMWARRLPYKMVQGSHIAHHMSA